MSFEIFELGAQPYQNLPPSTGMEKVELSGQIMYLISSLHHWNSP